MAFNGTLITVGGTAIPLTYIKYETYKITPNQRMDLDSTRNTLGVLVRNVLSHTASKVEFDTPPMNSTQQAAFMNLIRGAWNNTAERRVALTYFDPETDSMKSGSFYMPDIEWTIRNAEHKSNQTWVLNYNSARIAFIEY